GERRETRIAVEVAQHVPQQRQQRAIERHAASVPECGAERDDPRTAAPSKFPGAPQSAERGAKIVKRRGLRPT
ncbi:MAG TPA: hypothetical protein VFV10_01405, partial [Gammaproteobacteria bacterium]|nr:hypothetical protein [Gammaproteobacteria bacterium]